MANKYHDTIEPPYRIQKRLVLNQCFKTILARLGGDPKELTYITFGGSKLYDVLDLVCVFDVRKSRISIISYELNPELAKSANDCDVARALRKMNTVSIEVHPNVFEEDAFGPILAKENKRPFVYFLDYTDCFAERHKATVLSLLTSGNLRANDYLIITSCVADRVTKQEWYMRGYNPGFRIFFGMKDGNVTSDFKARNHVDLLVGQAISIYSKLPKGKGILNAELLSKYRYRDTKNPMGVWLYCITYSAKLPSTLSDMKFIVYPWAVSKGTVEEPVTAEPDLFGNL